MVVDSRRPGSQELLVVARKLCDYRSFTKKSCRGAYLEIKEVTKCVARRMRAQIFEFSETNHWSREGRRRMKGGMGGRKEQEI